MGLTEMTVYPYQKLILFLLNVNVEEINILSEHSNYVNVFLPEPSERTGINDHLYSLETIRLSLHDGIYKAFQVAGAPVMFIQLEWRDLAESSRVQQCRAAEDRARDLGANGRR